MTNRPMRGNDGRYAVKGAKYDELFGSRIQVLRKKAYKTAGGLIAGDLMMNKHGRVVSALKHRTAKREKRLQRAGYFTQKGKFGAIKKPASTRKRR